MPSCLALLITISLAVCAIAVVVFFAKRAGYRRWQKTTGKVIEHVLRETLWEQKPSFRYVPRISYRSASGDSFEFFPSIRSALRPAVGETVDVLYDPSRPHRAVLDRFMARHKTEFNLFVFGAWMTVLFGMAAFAH